MCPFLPLSFRFLRRSVARASARCSRERSLLVRHGPEWLRSWLSTLGLTRSPFVVYKRLDATDIADMSRFTLRVT